MAIALPEPVRDVLRDRAYGHVVTRNPDGSPQVTMVWMDVDGDEALFNTAEGRLKARNLRRDPRVVVSVQVRDEPQCYMVLHGTATLTAEGAEEHVDRLAQRFLGTETYPFRQPGEVRVLVRIAVERIGGMGPGMGPWV